jgi:DNA-binding NarL/FixJ family response regulator
MNDTKIITFVTELYDPALADQFSLHMNVECVNITGTHQLFRMISSVNYHTDLIILDIDKLSAYDGVQVLDMILALKTMINCSCCSKADTTTIPIALAVTSKTNTKLMREVLSVGVITGLYPRGDEFTLEEKISALTALLEHQHHVPQKINKLINEKKSAKKPKENSNEIKLTQRQQQILDLIVGRGASNKLIARMLNISESTVKLHMTQILKKHGLTNRTQLALFSKTKTLD